MSRDLSTSSCRLLRLHRVARYCGLLFFFFTDTATTEIYTLSLHDALPDLEDRDADERHLPRGLRGGREHRRSAQRDRKSTRLNSSHTVISYAVFCLKKKKIDTGRKHRGSDDADTHHDTQRASSRRDRSATL